MKAYAKASGDVVGAEVSTPVDAMELVGEHLMDERWWTQVRNHFDPATLKGFYIEAPIQKVGNYGIIPRFKNPDELSKTLGYGLSYTLDRINALPTKADALPHVVDELTGFRAIFAERAAIKKQRAINEELAERLQDPRLSPADKLEMIERSSASQFEDVPLPEIPSPEFLIDKGAIASRLREAAEDLARVTKEGEYKAALGDVANLTDSEKLTYEYLMTQATRLDDMPIATFAESINMRRLADTLIPYGTDGKFLLSKAQNNSLHKLRDFINTEVQSKMTRAFAEADIILPPPPLGAEILPGAAGADAVADALIATEKAQKMVNRWVQDNKMYGVLDVLAKGSTKKAQDNIASVLTATSPYLWAHIIGLGAGAISGYGVLAVTGAFAMHLVNTFGTQMVAQMRKSAKSQASFRRAAKSTESSLDNAIESLFSPVALSKKTARYSAFLAASSGDDE